jgi:hypothetical protein
MKAFFIKWVPRAIVATVGAYYGLGLAYAWGIMAVVDKVAIGTIKYFAGYVGIGKFMPLFQWYAAWGVRFVSGIVFERLYDLCEKIAKCLYHYLKAWCREPFSCCRRTV